MTVNLLDAWSPYKAAITALNNTLDPENIKDMVGTVFEILLPWNLHFKEKLRNANPKPGSWFKIFLFKDYYY